MTSHEREVIIAPGSTLCDDTVSVSIGMWLTSFSILFGR